MFIVAITQFVPLNQRCRRYFFEYLFIIVNLFLRARAFFPDKSIFALFLVNEISPLMSTVFIALSGFRR